MCPSSLLVYAKRPATGTHSQTLSFWRIGRIHTWPHLALLLGSKGQCIWYPAQQYTFTSHIISCELVVVDMSLYCRFSPEQLGITASSALIWTVIEILMLLFSMYIMNVTSALKLLDLLSYCAYKYIGSVNECTVWWGYKYKPATFLSGF